MAIKVLDPVVASRIAAGEVVENPSSALRELLDNAIDAQASKISVYLEDGGCKSLTVSDNGKGFEEKDLELVCTSHATSKISTLDDLFNLKTMGFRGEALASIAACSNLTISSNGNRLVIDNGSRQKITKNSSQKGCTIIMEDLFDRMPARKQFLKRSSSEGAACRKIFAEKAMCFPEIEFVYYEESTLKLKLDRTDKKGRILQIMSLDRDFVSSQCVTMEDSSENIRLFAIASDPSCHRRDRTRIRIFLNSRPIDNFALVQAITNSYSVALPGGAFPYFTLIIEDQPSLVDFNVHPAKRECRMRNQSEVFSLITHMIRRALLEETVKTQPKIEIPVQHEIFTQNRARTGHQARINFSSNQNKGFEVKESKPFDTNWFEKAKSIMEKKPAPANLTNSTDSTINTIKTTEIQSENQYEEKPWRYIGQLFKTFLIVEYKDDMLLIDQHAAHERLLYDEITSTSNVQELIIPYRFETDRSADDYLLENSFIYQELGVQLVRVQPMLWEITTIPALAKEIEEKLANFIKTATGDVQEAKKGLFAVIACHSAIKAGDSLDNLTAEKLVEKVFKLDAMLCPHGRSFVHRITKAQLYQAVGRTL